MLNIMVCADNLAYIYDELKFSVLILSVVKMRRRVAIEVNGIVQGVGFRPFVYALARRHALTGTVCNDTRGVLIEVEGESGAIDAFISALRQQQPPAAAIESIRVRPAAPCAHTDFTISDSRQDNDKSALIAADIAVCGDCLAELFDARDRRFRYAFINCVNCGPRFTIARDIPYDRARTAMADFPMCAHCQQEYESFGGRRFHAQPNACAACGPDITFDDGSSSPSGYDAVTASVAALARGEIIAIKGVGGYHLACDARNDGALARLRAGKRRTRKPFAVMVRDLAMAREYVEVDDAAAALLQTSARPIVLLRQHGRGTISPQVAGDLNELGIMLPYAPLHHLLLAQFGQPLVMTSGNLSDEPIARTNAQAHERLAAIADHFLDHDREIVIACDDSVARIVAGRVQLLRRARGYAPLPIQIENGFSYALLACGGELKSTFCLTRGQHAFISQHIGDLENFETLSNYQQAIEHYGRIFSITPQAVAYDLHPEYLSTKYALALSDDLPKIGVQHHHAHIVSCMAEHGLSGEVLGVAFDGLGYGSDGCFWGSEFLLARRERFTRCYHLDYVPLPGATRALKEPWRMAGAYLRQAYGRSWPALPVTEKLMRYNWPALDKMIDSNINSPLSAGMGRLFDAVAALIGIAEQADYEGEAAVALEQLTDADDLRGYQFDFDERGGIILAAPVIRAIIEDLKSGLARAEIATKFHNGVAGLIVDAALRIRARYGLRRVVLSGGVFQNSQLLVRALRLLNAHGFEAFTHARLPANDGGLCLGQAAVADALLKAG